MAFSRFLSKTATVLTKAASLVMTPLLYGLDKFLKSFINLVFKYYKPGRSFLRMLGISASIAGGAVLGASVGSLIFPGIGTAIGAVVGAICASSIGAFITKHCIRAYNWLADYIGYENPDEADNKDTIALYPNPTNQEKFSIKKSTYRTFIAYFNINTKNGNNIDKIPTLALQVQAATTAKNKLGFWSSFWWTEENAQKAKLNELITKIKKDPIAAVSNGKVEIGNVNYLWQPKQETWESEVKPFHGASFHI